MNNLFKNGGYQQPQFNNQQYGYVPQPVRYPAEPYQPFSNPPAISPPQGFFKGRPVVSVDEARAAQIDFDGSLYIFTDLGKGKIYTKQFNPDGTATLHTFVLAEEKDAEPSEYVTKAEFEAALSNIQATLGGVVKDAPSMPQQKKIEF